MITGLYTRVYISSDLVTLLATLYVALWTLLIGIWFIRQASSIRRGLKNASSPHQQFTRATRRIGVCMIASVILASGAELLRVKPWTGERNLFFALCNAPNPMLTTVCTLAACLSYSKHSMKQVDGLTGGPCCLCGRW